MKEEECKIYIPSSIIITDFVLLGEVCKMKQKKNKEKIDFKYNFGTYWKFLLNYKFIFIAILFLILIFESAHIAQIFIFKKLIDNGTAFSSGAITKDAFVSFFLIALAIFSGIIVIKTVSKWFSMHFVNRFEAGIIRDIKMKFFNYIINLSYSFHTTHKTGSLISRLTRSGGAVERMSDVLIFSFAPLVFQSIVIIGSLIYFSGISAIVIFITTLAFILCSFYIQNISQDANLKANDQEDFEKANIADIFTNVEAIKYFGKEKLIKHKFENLSWSTRLAYIFNWDYFRWLDSGQNLILGAGYFFLVYFSINQFLAGIISIGTLVFIYASYSSLIGSLFSFVYGIRGFYRSMADFDDLFQYGKIEQEVKDKPNAKGLKIREGNIKFKNVWFGYGRRIIFQSLNLKVPKGKKIALVGHSGSGKTTLVKLLYRFYDVNSGSISIDGKDIRDVKQESLREEMAVVPQECVLFDDTVYNNVAFSKPNASRKEIMQAIKFAQLDKIIKTFPEQENTIVGERGIKLSGGEKQRVSIARALLANKKVLVLDEATSSLDSKTEHEIQQDLVKLMQGRTTIIIAHRLSTIMNADKIIVMKHGKIVQEGTHEQLIEQEGEYKELWNLQRGGYIK